MTESVPADARLGPEPPHPQRPAHRRRILVVGWFSQRRGGSATAGDIAACRLVCDWLRAAGLPHDVALGDPFPGGVDWERVDPAGYTHLLHVCGPVSPDAKVAAVLERFAHARLIGVNVSMIQPLREWNPFDALIERDSSRGARPDLAFAAPAEAAPVAGVVQVGPQPEYPDGRHAAVDEAIERLLDGTPAARVRIDTRLHGNRTGLRSTAEIESLIAHMDVVVTTRLHGMVFALKHGVPAVAIDPIATGAKVSRQAAVIGWPVVLTADELSGRALEDAWRFCLSDRGRALARVCGVRAAVAAEDVRDQIVAAISVPRGVEAAR